MSNTQAMFKKLIKKRIVREVSAQKMTIHGREVSYTLVRSSRAKRLSLKIGEQSGFEVVVPIRTALSSVPRFLKQKEDWILKHVEDLEEQRAARPKIEDGSAITILGVKKKIRIFPTRKPKPHVKEARALEFDSATDTAYYGNPEILIYSNTSADARAALEKHLRKQAAQHFKTRTATVSQEMGTTYNRISIKGQKTRWGSCSREKNLNFNWRLLFATPEIVDSIIIHELAHTVHLNHSRRFYTLVEAHCPNHRALSKQLQKMSAVFPL